jgi:thiamine-phosphate pyrophosphorylase
MGFPVIIISPPLNVPGETEKVTALFKAGLRTFHLRKPRLGRQGLEKIITSIPEQYHPRIVIRAHFELARQYNLKGIHLTERERRKGGTVRMKGKTFSASLHSLTDAFLLRSEFDYVFISPVFDSISKSGLKTAIDLAIASNFMAEIRELPGERARIYALGGVQEKNIRSVKKAGFDGAAVLGAVWNSTDPVKAYRRLRSVFE